MGFLCGTLLSLLQLQNSLFGEALKLSSGFFLAIGVCMAVICNANGLRELVSGFPETWLEN